MKVRGYGRNCRMVFYVTEEWSDGLETRTETPYWEEGFGQ